MAEQEFEHLQPFWDTREEMVDRTLRNLYMQNKLALDNDTMKYKFVGIGDTESPWLFIRDTLDNKCAVLFDIKYATFNLIPQYCRTSCFKVVIKPTTVYELFQVYEIMKKLDYFGKVGIDDRWYTEGLYAAFSYNETMEEAWEKWKVLRRLVSEQIGDHVKIAAKKGCTEMEGKVPSDTWAFVPDGQIELEAMIDEKLDNTLMYMTQAPWVIRKKFRTFCKEANRVGDLSYKGLEHITGPLKGISIKSLTYHDKWSIDDDVFPG